MLTFSTAAFSPTADFLVYRKQRVPEVHLEAIIAFVDFRAHWERESTETYTGSSSSLILSQLGENGRRAWNRYREIMRSLAPVGGWTVKNPSWGGLGL